MKITVMGYGSALGWLLLLWAFLGLAFGSGACKSDTGGSKEPNVAAEVAGSDAGAAPMPAERKKKIEAGLARTRKQEEDIDRFNQKVLALQAELKKLPAAYKKNANGFSELETLFTDYVRMGAATKADVAKFTARLNYQLNPVSATPTQEGAQAPPGITDQETILEDNWEDQLGVFDRTISDYWEGIAKAEGMLEQLKNAKGAPVVLFK